MCIAKIGNSKYTMKLCQDTAWEVTGAFIGHSGFGILCVQLQYNSDSCAFVTKQIVVTVFEKNANYVKTRER